MDKKNHVIEILVIDDCKADREIITKYLKADTKKNINIEESDCLSTAVEKLKTKTYDVIILDLALPESDGVDTIRNIKQELNMNTPIIILTGLEDYQVGKEAFAIGIADFLIKGEINPQEIKRSIDFATYNHKLLYK